MSDVKLLSGLIFGVILIIVFLQITFILFYSNEIQIITFPFILLLGFCMLITSRYLKREKEYRELKGKTTFL